MLSLEMPMGHGFLAAVLDRMTEGVCLVDADNRVLAANSQWRRSIGWAGGKIEGRDILELSSETQDGESAVYSRARAGQSVNVPRYCQQAGGRETWWEGSVSPVSLDNGVGLLVTAREVSAHVQQEEEGETPGGALHGDDQSFASSDYGEGLAKQPGKQSGASSYDLLEPRDLFENMLNAFAMHRIILDDADNPVDYVFLEINGAFESVTGLARQAVLGKRVTELFPDIIGLDFDWIGTYGKVALTGKPIAFEQHSSLLNRTYLVHAYSPKPGYFATLFEDVTERRRTEIALAESRDFYLTILEEFPTLIWRAGRDAKYDYLNKSWLVFTGRTMEQESGDGWAEGVHPEDKEASVRTYLDSFSARHPFRIQYRLRRHDGQYRWLLDAGSPFYDQDGQFGGYIGSCLDITEHKQDMESVRESAERYRNMSDSLPITIYEMDLAGHFTFVNRSGLEQFSYSHDDFERGIQALSVIAPEDRERAQAAIVRQLSESGQPREIREYQMLRKDGTTFPGVTSSGRIIRDNEVIGLRGYVVDVAERQAAEQALRESEERFRRLAENAADLIYRYELLPERRFSYVSPAAIRIVGYSPEEYYADPDLGLKIVHPDDRSLLEDVTASQDFSLPAVMRWQHRAGHTIWIEQHSVPTLGPEGELVAIECIARDITKRRLAELQIQRQLERITALHTTGMAISSSLDLRVSLSVLLDQLTSQLGVHAAMVLLLNPHSLTLEYITERGFRSRSTAARSQVRLGQGEAGRAALERRMVKIEDLREMGVHFSRPALLSGEDFVAYYAMPLIAKGRVKGVLEIFQRGPLDPDPEWLEFLDILAGQSVTAIDNATLFGDLQRLTDDLTIAYDATIEGLAKALELRDVGTEGHSRRVTEMTVELARVMGVREPELVQVRRGALLHDIGKVGVPDSILLKPSSLDENEWEVMRMHPIHAQQLLTSIDYLREAVAIPYGHHEMWDGSGYPRGLKGEDIPLATRCFTVVDVFDALISDRPYRVAWSEERAREYIESQAGGHFDPAVVKAFLRLDLGRLK